MLPHHPELRRSADRSVQLVLPAAIYVHTNAPVADEVEQNVGFVGQPGTAGCETRISASYRLASCSIQRACCTLISAPHDQLWTVKLRRNF